VKRTAARLQARVWLTRRDALHSPSKNAPAGKLLHHAHPTTHPRVASHLDRITDAALRRNVALQDRFHRFALSVSHVAGSPVTFLAAVGIILLWVVTGPLFGFSDTWQLFINTGTTIVTFLMVFLIQNTQNRDAKAMHLKLDELLRAVSDARNQLVDLEDLSDEELDRLQREFERIHRRALAQGVSEKR
jgi:low affinity Fe/Cu permease